MRYCLSSKADDDVPSPWSVGEPIGEHSVVFRGNAPSMGYGTFVKFPLASCGYKIPEGAWQPIMWMVPATSMTSEEAWLELARRYRYIYGPTAP